MSRRETPHPRLGEQIDRLVHSVAVTKGWKMLPTMTYISQQTNYSPDMIHRWRQGKSRPSREVVETLAQIGKKDANLPREWGESFLNAARYGNTEHIINKLWGPKIIHPILCNLPSRDRTDLVGRTSEISRLLELLSPHHAAPLIIVDGIGGVGKTALALEAAYNCWQASTGEKLSLQIPSFKAIIFVSAKQYRLTSDGILPSKDAKRTLRDIIHTIASILNHPEITYAAPPEQFSRVYEVLAQQNTLLIVDNLETMVDIQEVISFLYDLPRSVKVVITSRESLFSFASIRLDQLSQEATLDLVEKEAQEKDVKVDISHATKLYNHIGGIPAAIIYTIGQIAGGYSIETVLEKMPKADSDVARFCFDGSLGLVRGQAAYQLLIATAMFPKSPLHTAIAATAGLNLDPKAVEDGLALLNKFSLVKRKEDRCMMLPLTREYALSELATQPSFEQEARGRWVEWYQNFAQEFGGKDWGDWRTRYDKLEAEWENLLTVFEWCASHEKYDDIQIFWQEKSMAKFAHIYGFWDDRLFWLNWLVQAAEKRGDWPNAVEAMIDIGATFTLIGQFEEANQYLQRGLKLRSYASPQIQVLLLQKIAYLAILQEDFTRARLWLDQTQILLTSLALDEREYARRWADFYSNKGLLFYQQKDYDQARPFYQEMSKLAKKVDHRRLVDFAQNHLAYIAIVQGELDEAELLLQISLPTSKDKRLAAFHKYVLACFYQKKENFAEARLLARGALEGFESLEMKQEARDANELLQLLQD